jgi:hypothetical protein
VTVKKIKPRYPCPLCDSEMSFELTINAHRGFNDYVAVNVKASCSNDKCRYEERTKGHSKNMETVEKMRDVVASYRGAEMFKQGRFEEGNIGINRRRHTGIGHFEPVTAEEVKGRKR